MVNGGQSGHFFCDDHQVVNGGQSGRLFVTITGWSMVVNQVILFVMITGGKWNHTA